jgi:hypothetical protein
MPFVESRREEWEAKPNAKNCLHIVDKCANSRAFRGKPVRYGTTRIVIDGPDDAQCWFRYAASDGVDCIVEPRVHNNTARAVKTLLREVGFEPIDHPNRPTIDIPVRIDQVNDTETWSFLEEALATCATRM